MNKETKSKEHKKYSLLKWIIIGTVIALSTIGIGIGIVFVILPYGSGFGITKKYIPDEESYEQFNPKYLKDGTKNPEYNPRYISVKEWPYTEVDGQKKYFLGPKGRQQLAKSFARKGGYGGETSELIDVNINKQKIKNVHTVDANGLFISSYSKIYLSLDSYLYDRNNRQISLDTPWYDVSTDIKVELLLPTLIHEYMHHTANVYAQSMVDGDEFGTNEIIDNMRIDKSLKLTKDSVKEYGKTIYNKKFLHDFKEALFFDNDDKKLLADPKIFNVSRSKSVYQNYTPAKLFKIANGIQDKNNNWGDFKTKKYTFNQDKNEWLSYVKILDEKDMNYYFSFEELIPREFLKLSYIPKELFSKSYTSKGGYFGFANSQKHIFITSYTEDINRVLGLYPAPSYSYGDIEIDKTKLFGANWVFNTPFESSQKPAVHIDDDILDSWSVIEYSKKPKSLPDTEKRHKLLYKSYLDLLGYGLPISQIYSDNSFLDLVSEKGYDVTDSKFQKAGRKSMQHIYFDGYINYSHALVAPKKLRQTFIHNNHLVIENNGHKNILNIALNGGNLKTKSDWKNSEQEGGQDLGPEYVGLDSRYLSYTTTDSLDMNKFDLNKPSKFYFWEDENKDSKIQKNEITMIGNEIQYNRYKDIKRRITNYRRTVNGYLTDEKTYSLDYKKDPKNNSFVLKFNYYG